MKTWLMALVALGLSCCASLQDWPQAGQYNNGEQLVIETSAGTLVYDLNMRRPDLVYPFIHQVDEGYYDGLYVDRLIPGIAAFTGDGQWGGKAAWHIASFQPPGRGAKVWELGIVASPDGTYGPELAMMLSEEWHATAALDMPPTLVLGWLVEGREVLRDIRKGDHILQVYGRGFSKADENAWRTANPPPR